MKASSATIFLGLMFLANTTPACDLVDVATAETVLASEVQDMTVDPATFCSFISTTTSANFSVRVDPADMYDIMTIQQPHTPVDVGDRGRYHEFERGGAAVQFAKGSRSVTLAVTPGGDRETDFLPALLAAAKSIADKLD